jgi:hypothetical protein
MKSLIFVRPLIALQLIGDGIAVESSDEVMYANLLSFEI